MNELNIKKLYYSISEVSKMTSLKPYVLRYWESEFSQLRPSKNRAGNRIYRSNDIKTIFLIKKLLYTDKYTIDGARQKLNKISENNRQLNISFHDEKMNSLVNELKKGLSDILKILNGN